MNSSYRDRLQIGNQRQVFSVLAPYSDPELDPQVPVTNNTKLLDLLSRTGCKWCDMTPPLEIDECGRVKNRAMVDETHPAWWVVQVHGVEVQRNSEVELEPLSDQEILQRGVRLSHLQCRLTFGDDTKDNHVYVADIGTGFTCSQRAYNVKIEILHPPAGGPAELGVKRGPGLLLDSWIGASASIVAAPRAYPTLTNTQTFGMSPGVPRVIPIPTGSKYVHYYQAGGIKADLFWSTAQGPGFPAPNIGDLYGQLFQADKQAMRIPEFAKSIVLIAPGPGTRYGTLAFQLEI